AMFAGAWGIRVLLRGGGSNIEPARAGVVELDRPVPFIAGREIYGGGRFAPPVFHRRILVVNFWNPYCSPCRAEATVLDLSLGSTRLMHAKVTFAGVLYSNANFPHDVAAARRFARLYGERYPTIDE